MAASRTIWVKPRVSSDILDKLFPLPLRGTDRVNFLISHTQILPGALDETRLLKALEDTVTFYPHCSGRVRQRGDEWTLGAGIAGVPVTFQTIDEPFDHYQYPVEASAHLVDSVTSDISGSADPEWDEPLMRLKVTACPTTEETYIGWSSSHMLGDGEFCYQFIHTWSQYYMGLNPKFGHPTYDKYHNAPPDEHSDNPATAKFIAQYLPHLETLYPITDWMSMIGEVMANTENVDLLFTPHQITQIQHVANQWPSNDEVVCRISSQDALAAYIITVLNQCLPVPVTRISNILSYRGARNPDNLAPDDWRIPGPLAVGNAIFQAFTPNISVEEGSSLGAMARAIRKSIEDARHYDHLKRVVAVSNPIWLRQSQEKSEHQFWPGEGGLVLNAFGKLPLPKVDFGFGTERTRNIQYGTFPGYIRFFAASPVKLADGKSWASNENAMWMFVRIPSCVKDKFLATVASELHSPAFPQNLVARERRVLAGTMAKARL